jgi:predicted DNA binding CopG/RHH family protein
MKRAIDFSKGRRNPYAAKLKRSITIRLDTFTIDYFKALAAETEIPYQTLINLYLRECAGTGRRLAMEWRTASRGAA